MKEFITNHIKELDAGLDEDCIFAYERDVTTRGIVRFKTTTQILRFVRRPDMESKIT